MSKKPTCEELEIKAAKLKQVEKALHDSEELYRGVVENTPGLVCKIRPGVESTFVNKTYCEYFDKSPEELIGSKFLSLISEADRFRNLS